MKRTDLKTSLWIIAAMIGSSLVAFLLVIHFASERQKALEYEAFINEYQFDQIADSSQARMFKIPGLKLRYKLAMVITCPTDGLPRQLPDARILSGSILATREMIGTDWHLIVVWRDAAGEFYFWSTDECGLYAIYSLNVWRQKNLDMMNPDP